MDEVLDKLPAEQQTKPTIIPIKSTIPCKLFQNITSSFVGISDAGLDSTTAYNQAYTRALSMISLQNAFGRGMSDFYNDTNNEQLSSNYEELCEINATNNLAVEAIKIYDSFWLDSGEFIIFLNLDSSKVNPNQRIKNKNLVSIYYKENEQDGNKNIYNKISIENEMLRADNSSNHSESLTYILGNNRWLSNETNFDNKKIETNRYKIFYNTEKDCIGDSTEYKSESTSSVDGLWYALLNNMYSKLSAQLKEHYLKVKEVGDKYSDKTMTLYRESGYFRFCCRLQSIQLVDNRLITTINTEFF